MRLESGDSPVNPVHRWVRMLVGGAYAYPRLPTPPTCRSTHCRPPAFTLGGRQGYAILMLCMISSDMHSPRNACG